MDLIRYTVVHLLAGVYLLSLYAGGWWLLAMPAISFGLIPLLDELTPRDDAEPERTPFAYDWLLRLYAPIQLLAIGVSLWVLPQLSAMEIVLCAVALGVLCGAGGINVAHELMHRPHKGDKALAEILMMSTSYTWFCVEHVLGHHRWVGTPNDPATSRLGESVYAFVPRSIVGGLRSAWQIEGELTARRNIRFYHLANRRTRYAFGLLSLYAVLYAQGGALSVGFFLAQSAVAIALLEVINYVEHYGLVREQTASGAYERVKPEHSWNSNHAVTAAFLFNLPRHADHHAFASRPYHALRAWPDAPTLPLGYSSMVLSALVPPLWFWLMDARAASVREKTHAA